MVLSGEELNLKAENALFTIEQGVFYKMAEVDGNRTHRGRERPPSVLKTVSATRLLTTSVFNFVSGLYNPSCLLLCFSYFQHICYAANLQVFFYFKVIETESAGCNINPIAGQSVESFQDIGTLTG